MRLVDDERAVRRQHVRAREPGDQQRVIDHDQLGRRRQATRLAPRAVAAGPAAPRRCRTTARSAIRGRSAAPPGWALQANSSRSPVAVASTHSAASVSARVARRAALLVLGDVQLPATRAQVVVLALEAHDARSGAHRLGDARQVVVGELALQLLGVRRDDDRRALAPAPQERRHQVAQRLADAGRRLGEQRAALAPSPRRRRARSRAAPRAPRSRESCGPAPRPGRAVDRRDGSPDVRSRTAPGGDEFFREQDRLRQRRVERRPRRAPARRASAPWRASSPLPRRP